MTSVSKRLHEAVGGGVLWALLEDKIARASSDLRVPTPPVSICSVAVKRLVTSRPTGTK